MASRSRTVPRGRAGGGRTEVGCKVNDIERAQQELAEEFGLLSDWTDRYQYIIDLGRRLPAFPDALRTEANRLHGCQSQVWLITRAHGDTLEFQAVSDSAIVSGLIAILMRVYSGRSARDIVDTPASFVAALGLDQHLSPTRSTGLNAMIRAIKQAAADCLAA